MQLLLRNKSLPLIALAFCFFAAQRAAAVVTYAPPEDSADVANEIRVIQREMAGKNFEAAAKRIAALLENRADVLIRFGEEAKPNPADSAAASLTKISVSAWIDQLPADQRKQLRAACEAEYGKPASQQADGLSTGADNHIEDGWRIARRYPFTGAAGDALSHAGDLATRVGDLSAARVLYEKSLSTGDKLTDDREKWLGQLRRWESGEAIPAPKDLEGAGGGMANAPRGELPVDALWYGSTPLAGALKWFPIGDGAGGAILASWNKVARISGEGRTIWSATNPKSPGIFPLTRFQPGARGPIFQPAVLFDLYGRPAVIIARQPGQHEEDAYELRAFAGSDGRLLWSTDSLEGRRELSYAGLPAVAGRCVFTIAVARVNQSTAAMTLVCTDASTGQSLWQSNLGQIAEADTRFGRPDRAGYLELWRLTEISEPAVWGDLVVVSPGIGSVIAVGRFDGKIRWVHTYAGSAIPEIPVIGRGGRFDRPAAAGLREWEAKQAARRPLVRYRGTPIAADVGAGKGVIVAMPQDSPSAFGLDAATGRRLWQLGENVDLDAIGLAGSSGKWIVFTGVKEIIGAEIATAKLRWKYAPPPGITLTGPATVQRDHVIVPTSRGIIQLGISDGKESKVDASSEVWKKLLASDSWKELARELSSERPGGK